LFKLIEFSLRVVLVTKG